MRIDRVTLGWAAGMIVVAAAWAWNMRQFEETKRNAPNTPQYFGSSIRTYVGEQDAEGVTEADLTPAYAQSFAAHTAARSAELAKQHTSEPMPALTSAGAIITVDGKRLAVARTMAEGQVIALTVLGIQGTSAVRVACVAMDDTPVQLTSPQCRQAIEQAYSVSFVQ